MSRVGLRAVLRADLAANRGYPKSVVVLVLLRVAQSLRGRPGPGRLGYVVAASVYKLVAEWVLGVEIPPSTSVGPGLRLRHGVGVVVNPATVIGRDVLLRQGVTLGNRRSAMDCPVLQDGVEVGANATVVGPVTVGAGSRLGPGVVVVTDVPPDSVVYLEGVVVRPRRRTGAGEDGSHAGT